MTKTRKHHWLFKLWVKTRGLLAVSVILIGVLVGTLSLLLPFESLYKDRLINFLQQQWNMQVEVGSIEGSWQGYGPSFNLQNLSLSGNQTLHLKSAQINLNLYQWLIPGGDKGIDLSINSAALAMIQSGPSVSIKSDVNEQQLSQTLDRLLEAGSLRVDALKLTVLDDHEQPILTDITADFLLQQDHDNRALQLIVQESEDEQLEIRAISQRNQKLMETAQWYMRFDHISAAFLKPLLSNTPLPDANLTGELWLSTEDGVITAANGYGEWQQSTPELKFKTVMSYQGNDQSGINNWQFSDLSTKDEQFADFNINGQWQDNVSDYRSNQIPIGWAARLLSGLSTSTEGINPELMAVASSANGILETAQIKFNHQNRTLLSAEVDFKDLSVQSPKFSVNALAGSYHYAQAVSHVRIDSRSGQLNLPEVIRGDVQWQQLLTQFDWYHSQPEHNKPDLLKINQLWCDCVDFKIDANASLLFNDVPQLQLNSHIQDAVMGKLHKYWPYNIWKPKTMTWLDQGLLGGSVSQARMTISGEMREDTFKEGHAQFDVKAQVDGGEVLFDPGWPKVKNIQADTEITAQSIAVKIHSATTADIKLKPSEVVIPDFKDVSVQVSAHAESKDNELLQYLKNSPIAGDILLDDAVKLGGRQQLFLNLDIPINAAQNKNKNLLEPDGYIAFENGFFSWQDLQLQDLNGTVKLDGFKLKPINLKAQLAGSQTILNGIINTHAGSGVQLDMNLTGQYDLKQLFDMQPAQLPISGQSQWQMSLKNDADAVVLTAQSDLKGVAINLPSPFSKTADEIKPLSVSCKLPCDRGAVDINWGSLLSAQIRAAKDHFSLAWLKFGALVARPAVNSITGDIKTLDLDAWLKLFNQWSTARPMTAAKGTATSDFISVDINADKLIFMSRTFEGVHLVLTDTADGMEVEVAGPALKGTIDIADDVTRQGVTVEFEYLHWQEADVKTLTADDTDNSIPDIHLWVKEFSFADVPLGSLRMELRNVADGIKIEQLNMKSELMEINANGEWLRESDGRGTSRFSIVMISERIADFLQQMDFNPPISNAQTLIEMDVFWPGLPSQFDVQKLSGKLKINLGQGEVLDQQPGFGRVLGLFNLTNLPRRLLLDFRDVLSEGLRFELMEGSFFLENGVASTDDFYIKASSASINMNGLISFVDKTYDQMITIRPQIGKTFPTIGAIAGGPVGAAAGFLVQGLLGKKLKESNEINYKVTGSWEQPTIELLDNKDD